MDRLVAPGKLDPAMARTTHSGAPAGKGAIYAWKGNKDVGSGRMEITEAAGPAKVLIKLDFLEPFAAQLTLGPLLAAAP